MQRPRFATLAWSVLVYNVLVILWGAFVRASGSGAGCGSHWPMCNGEVIPRAPRLATVIEFSHRLSSGLALVAVIGLVIAARRSFPRGHVVRRGAALSLALIVAEALLGAGLVLFQYVADDASIGRALAMPTHLTNTFGLLAALTVTAWWGSGHRAGGLRGQGPLVALFGAGLLGILLVGTSGAITALGDTLFPGQSHFSVASNRLLRWGLLHPIVATVVSVGLIALSATVRALRPHPSVLRTTRLMTFLVAAQYGLGVLNVALRAPTAMQLAHLFLADLVWITTVLAFVTALAAPLPERPTTLASAT